MAIKQKKKKIAAQITDSLEQRIVEVSLQNPDFGSRRLVALLEQEGITVTTSAVHAILKRNDLHTKYKRLSKLEARRSEETPPEPTDSTSSTTEQQDHVPAHTLATKSKVSIPQSFKALKRTNPRPPWSLNFPNLLLLGIVGYFWVSAAANYLQAGREPMLPSDATPLTVESKPDTPVRPLKDYNIIAERNLFGSSAAETTAAEEAVSLEDIPIAGKNLGLKLVGTVAGDDSARRFAIIDNKSTRKQELYHEGDKAGELLIKRILRNKVIVDAGRGEELLALELEESGKRIDFSPAPQKTERSVPSTARHRNLRLDRKEVEASLADIDGLIQQVKLSPYTSGTQRGFMITDIPPNSIFTKIGLSSGDVIRSINDQPITGPEDATAFLQKVKQGGDVEITLSRRRRTTQISLKIE
jgi:general secretion pathway protein C